MVSWLVAELSCGACGARAEVEMQTHLEPWPQRNLMRVGDEVGLGWPDVERAYLPLREPGPGEPVRFLQAWECPDCGAVCWAEVVLDGGRIAAISEAQLDAATLDRVHAIDDAVEGEYERLTGEPLFVDGRARPGFGERLREALRR
jgi:transcription elongation factor Elf1